MSIKELKMKIKCRYFFNPEDKKLIKNCVIYWDKSLKQIKISDNSNEYEKELEYVIPAFKDQHVHLFLSGFRNSKIREKELSCSESQSIKNVISNIKRLKKAGIFQVMDAGDSKWSALKVRDMQIFDDFEVKLCGKALFKRGRYGSFIGIEIFNKKSLKDALKILKEKNVDFIKVLNSGINSIKEYAKETDPQFTDSEMEYIVKFAKEHNLEVIVHVNGEKAIRQTIKHNISRLEHAFFIKDENLIKDIAQKGIRIVPTFRAMLNLKDNETLSEFEKEIIEKTVDNHIKEIKKFLKYGGKLELGTDSGSYNVIHGKSFYDEIEFFMTKLEFSFEEILSLISSIKSPAIIELKEFSFSCLNTCPIYLLHLQPVPQNKPGL